MSQLVYLRSNIYSFSRPISGIVFTVNCWSAQKWPEFHPFIPLVKASLSIEKQPLPTSSSSSFEIIHSHSILWDPGCLPCLRILWRSGWCPWLRKLSSPAWTLFSGHISTKTHSQVCIWHSPKYIFSCTKSLRFLNLHILYSLSCVLYILSRRMITSGYSL